MFDWGFIESDGVTTIGGASWKSEAEQRKVLAWIPELDEDMPIFVIDLLDEKRGYRYIADSYEEAAFLTGFYEAKCQASNQALADAVAYHQLTGSCLGTQIENEERK